MMSNTPVVGEQVFGPVAIHPPYKYCAHNKKKVQGTIHGSVTEETMGRVISVLVYRTDSFFPSSRASHRTTNPHSPTPSSPQTLSPTPNPVFLVSRSSNCSRPVRLRQLSTPSSRSTCCTLLLKEVSPAVDVRKSRVRSCQTLT